MSNLSNQRSKASVPTNHFNSDHLLPGQPVVAQQQSLMPKQSLSEEQIARIQQVDAGMMQTLHLQAERAISAPEKAYPLQTTRRDAQGSDLQQVQSSEGKITTFCDHGGINLFAACPIQEKSPLVGDR